MLTLEQINDLTLVKYPHPALQQEAKRIERLDTWVEQLALKMIELMHRHHGVGLAANQVGVALQVFVANPTTERGKELVLVNPEIVDATGWEEHEEGCLSLPDIRGKIRRRQKVVVEATDLAGNRRVIDTNNLLARIVQHETDHLAGTLILRRMSAVARLAARRQIKKLEADAR